MSEAADGADTAAPSAAPTAAPTEVVTCFLRHRADVLLVRRSARVGSYRGRWGAVAGHVETDEPLEDAWREIEEETGLQDAATLVKRGEPFAFEDRGEGRSWRVHPFLFDVSSRDARLDWEAVEGAWVPPTAILERDCVPRLWTSYARVAPTLEDVRDDREHGSAYLSLRALEVLRDRAAALEAGAELPGTGAGSAATAAASTRRGWIELAGALVAGQPAMTALLNRVDEVMSAALEGPAPSAPDGARLERRMAATAQAVLHEALAAEDGVAAAAARRVAGRSVLTLSLSGTVLQALLTAVPPPRRVVVCESRPGGEGQTLARRLAERGIEAAVVPDAAVAWALERFAAELLLVGADTVLPDGAVVNKVGTRPAALAAHAAGVPVMAAAARAKIAAEGRVWTGEGEEVSVPEARPDVTVAGDGPTAAWQSPLFERTPAELVDAIVTEAGAFGPAEVRAVAARHAARRSWAG
jgi:translation initiation factor 2B subunit (eIF-2B alpha/beta/delta family)